MPEEAGYTTMSGPTDYYWSDTEETHRYRKREMLRTHGEEIRKLFGPDRTIFFLMTPFVLLQLYIGLHAGQMGWPTFLLAAHFVGGTITHSCFLAIHEVAHNLCFHTPLYNDLYAIFLNIIVPLPYAMLFKVYHAEHHRYQGWDGVDSDLPTQLEAKLFSSFLGKYLFITFQVAFYAFRPPLVNKVRFGPLQLLNYIVQFALVAAIREFWGWWPILYFFFSIVMGTGWHPLAGHFISEHYVFKGNWDQETFSYYGFLNKLTWNAGYHVEHHDFPNIPWTRIAKLNTIAPEFYVDLKRTESWYGTLFDFLLDPSMNLYCRVKRERGAKKRERRLPTSTKLMPTALPHKGPCEWRL